MREFVKKHLKNSTVLSIGSIPEGVLIAVLTDNKFLEAVDVIFLEDFFFASIS